MYLLLGSLVLLNFPSNAKHASVGGRTEYCSWHPSVALHAVLRPLSDVGVRPFNIPWRFNTSYQLNISGRLTVFSSAVA